MAISFGNSVTLKQAAQLIAAGGSDVRVMLRGEPGIGKSSIMKTLEDRFGSAYAYCYFDCGNKDLGDTAMPSPNRDLRVTEYFPNAVFQLQKGKPVIIMLDEFTKAPMPVQNMLHPMLESRNPRLGDVPLPEGSIVFLTGNLGSDGVGDVLKGHTQNRITEIVVAKPAAEEWIDWAIGAGIDSSVVSWVHQYPHCLESYSDGAKDNPYIYNPRTVQKAYVTPRSLELASNWVKKRDHFDSDALIAALSGTIGEAAARDMQAYIDYQDQLPAWEDIIKSPDKTKVPDSPGASAVTVFGAIQKVDKTNLAAWGEYLDRFEVEWQAVFYVNAMKSARTQKAMLEESKTMHAWQKKNMGVL